MQVSQLLLISMYLSPPKYLPRSPNAISTVRSAHDGRHPFSFWTLFLLCVLRFDLFHNFCLRWCKTFTTFPIMNRTCNALTNKHTLLLLFLVTESQIKIIPQFTSLTVHTRSQPLWIFWSVKCRRSASHSQHEVAERDRQRETARIAGSRYEASECGFWRTVWGFPPQ